MKRQMLAAALSAFAFAAMAQTQAAAPQTGTTVETGVQASAPVDAKQSQAKKKLSDSQCLRQTGSRIQSRAKGDCAAYGRSYDRDDLNSTGETDIASALRRLDPSVH